RRDTDAARTSQGSPVAARFRAPWRGVVARLGTQPAQVLLGAGWLRPGHLERTFLPHRNGADRSRGSPAGKGIWPDPAAAGREARLIRSPQAASGGGGRRRARARRRPDAPWPRRNPGPARRRSAAEDATCSAGASDDAANLEAARQGGNGETTVVRPAGGDA